MQNCPLFPSVFLSRAIPPTGLYNRINIVPVPVSAFTLLKCSRGMATWGREKGMDGWMVENEYIECTWWEIEFTRDDMEFEDAMALIEGDKTGWTAWCEGAPRHRSRQDHKKWPQFHFRDFSTAVISDFAQMSPSPSIYLYLFISLPLSLRFSLSLSIPLTIWRSVQIRPAVNISRLNKAECPYLVWHRSHNLLTCVQSPPIASQYLPEHRRRKTVGM